MNKVEPMEVFQNLSDINEELDLMDQSLQNIHRDLEKLLHQGMIKRGSVSFYQSLAKKSKDQSIAAQKLRKKLNVLQNDSTMQFLDHKIEELGKKIERI